MQEATKNTTALGDEDKKHKKRSIPSNAIRINLDLSMPLGLQLSQNTVEGHVKVLKVIKCTAIAQVTNENNYILLQLDNVNVYNKTVEDVLALYHSLKAKYKVVTGGKSVTVPVIFVTLEDLTKFVTSEQTNEQIQSIQPPLPQPQQQHVPPPVSTHLTLSSLSRSVPNAAVNAAPVRPPSSAVATAAAATNAASTTSSATTTTTNTTTTIISTQPVHGVVLFVKYSKYDKTLYPAFVNYAEGRRTNVVWFDSPQVLWANKLGNFIKKKQFRFENDNFMDVARKLLLTNSKYESAEYMNIWKDVQAYFHRQKMESQAQQMQEFINNILQHQADMEKQKQQEKQEAQEKSAAKQPQQLSCDLTKVLKKGGKVPAVVMVNKKRKRSNSKYQLKSAMIKKIQLCAHTSVSMSTGDLLEVLQAVDQEISHGHLSSSRSSSSSSSSRRLHKSDVINAQTKCQEIVKGLMKNDTVSKATMQIFIDTHPKRYFTM
jgi:hypothetical protein